MQQVQAPPNDLVAEQATLGAMLIEPGATDIGLSTLREQDFYREAHRIIFGAMLSVQGRGEPVDIVTVAAELRRQDKLEAVGGGEYLTALIAEVPTAAHVRRYAGIVREKALLRTMIHEAALLQQKAYANPEKASELLATTAHRITMLQESVSRRSDLVEINRLADHDMGRVIQRMNRPYSISRQRFGIMDLDAITGGLEDAGLLVIKGATNAGKTSLLFQCILSTAMQPHDKDEAVVAFGMEEDGWRWTMRAACWLAQVDGRKLQSRPRLDAALREEPDLEDRFWSQGFGLLTCLPILRATGPQSLGSIEAACRRILRRGIKPTLVALDYLQLIEPPEGKDTEEQRMREVAERLTVLRDMVRCPILATSQVTVGPNGTYTFGAKAFEHNADTIASIARERDADAGTWSDELSLSCEKGREITQWPKMKLRLTPSGRWFPVTEEDPRADRRHDGNQAQHLPSHTEDRNSRRALPVG